MRPTLPAAFFMADYPMVAMGGRWPGAVAVRRRKHPWPETGGLAAVFWAGGKVCGVMV